MSIDKKLRYFPISLWSAKDFNIYFIFIESKTETIIPLGELKYNNAEIPINIWFRTSPSVDVENPLIESKYGSERMIFFAGCEMGKDKLIMNIVKVFDEKYNFLVNKKIVFTREDLTEEEALKMRNEIIEKYGLNLESDSAGS